MENGSLVLQCFSFDSANIIASLADSAATLEGINKEYGLDHAIKALASGDVSIRYQGLKVSLLPSFRLFLFAYLLRFLSFFLRL